MLDQLSFRRTLNLSVARAVAHAAEAEARQQGWSVSIAIVDESGRLLYFLRMDGTSNASVEVAIAKAQHAVNYRRDTAFHQDLLEKGTLAVLSLPASLPVEGGVRLLADEEVLGAIGVSGAQSREDGRVAEAGTEVLRS